MAFIVFEGLDGSGKSTLIAALQRHLKSVGKPVVVTREPGGTELAEEIRKIVLRKGEEIPSPRTEVLLYQASRAQHVDMVIAPALALEQWVICDRFYGSTVAFQVFGRKLDAAQIDWLNDYAVDGSHPDLTFFLDLDVKTSQERVHSRAEGLESNKDRFEIEKIDFHERVREGFLFQTKSKPNWVLLDARLKPEKLFESLLEKLKERGLLI